MVTIIQKSHFWFHVDINLAIYNTFNKFYSAITSKFNMHTKKENYKRNTSHTEVCENLIETLKYFVVTN